MKDLLLLFMLSAVASSADFDAGLAAYNRGDYPAALAEWQPLAEQGDANAQYNLGLLYNRGNGALADPAKALEWYRKAALQGVAAAQFNLAVMYANGEGVSTDPEQARKWLLEAAGQGIAEAELNLGRLYSDPKVSFHDYGEAARRFTRAAEKGIPSAAFNLGLLYDLGRGVPQDYKQAMKWYLEAANAGDTNAMTNIGVLYYNGQGVPRDRVQAYAWITRAGRAGSERAVDLISWVSETLSPADIRKGEALAASWHPQPVPPPAGSEALFKPKPRPAEALAAAAPQTGGDSRVVVAAEAGGDPAQLSRMLREAGLIDGAGNWTGANAHLVEMGGAGNSPEGASLLARLQRQAAGAGGAVDWVWGLGAADPSGAERADPSGPPPLHTPAARFGRTLYVHANLGAQFDGWTLDPIVHAVRGERDLGEAGLNSFLEQFQVDRIVVFDPAASAPVTQSFGGRLVRLGSGRLEIETGGVFAFRDGRRMPLQEF